MFHSVIPKYTILSILKEWLDLIEICTLDSALCNHVERLIYLNYLTLDSFSLNNRCEEWYCSSNCLSWLSLRNMSVRSLCLYLVQNAKSTLNFSSIVTSLEDVVINCDKLDMNECQNVQHVSSAIKALRNADKLGVLHLHFTGNTGLPLFALELKQFRCKQLTEFQLHSANIVDQFDVQNCPTNLVTLNFTFCKLSDVLCEKIFKHNPRITDLTWNDNEGNCDIQKLVQYISQYIGGSLTCLVLIDEGVFADQYWIEKETVELLCNSCSQLTTLTINVVNILRCCAKMLHLTSLTVSYSKSLCILDLTGGFAPILMPHLRHKTFAHYIEQSYNIPVSLHQMPLTVSEVTFEHCAFKFGVYVISMIFRHQIILSNQYTLLHTIKFRHCSRISELNHSIVLRCCKYTRTHLNTLHFEHCNDLTDSLLAKILNMFESLDELIVIDCPLVKVSRAAIQKALHETSVGRIVQI